MKAIRLHEFGGPEVLLFEDAPTPVISDDQMLVRVHAAGINPVDGKIRSGEFHLFRPQLPATIGRDLSGVIEQVGSRVSGWREGDEVFGMIGYERGAYAELAAALPIEIARKPAEIDHLHAGVIGVAGLTAWQSLFDQGELQAGQRVLIHGGGGGVGHFAVQFAALHGAEVIATASPKDIDFVRSLGAAEVIDYKAQHFEKTVRGIDLVLDLIAGETRARSWQVLKPGGLIVSTLGEPEVPPNAPARVRGRATVVRCEAGQLTEIAQLAASGRLRIELAKVYSLAEARQAHEQMENAHSRGKTVLKVSD
ncbi:MAG TPA: NADP-dependent oxidoreductase [Chthoniobacterales bacterium]|nr:NADP-dependent oxidoreductase [Chthoniobacterales bacterium]